MVVDDDVYNTQTLEVLLHSGGYRTITANEGQQALFWNGMTSDIHAIILDLKMPVMDGFELLAQMSEISELQRIPVIILSANVTIDVIDRLRRHNVDRIMEKPFEMDELMYCLNQIFEYNAYDDSTDVLVKS